MTNKLFYGDNLGVLREHIADGSIDLVYLDPPFNSNATYNVLFKAPDGHESQSQIEAFDDTWQWGETAENAYWEVLHGPNTDAARMLEAMRGFLGENAMMAYLAMMGIRLIELHHVLKSTGSIYLHCDTTAGHYLKVLLDSIFGIKNYRSQIIWKRQSAHSDAKGHFSDISDIIFHYTKSNNFTFNVQRGSLDETYVEKFYRHKDSAGRRYRLSDMSAPEGGGMAAINKVTGKPNGWYVWKGYQPPSRGWRYSPETMQKLHDEGKIYYPESKSKRLQLKRFLDENEGQVIGNIWTDIQPLHGSNQERLGYPTQKPVSLLERIILASSNEGDVVLDPFCGCGTTVHAAQKLGREWVGIDITHLAISLIERRLRDAFRDPPVQFQTFGVPKDIGAARKLAEAEKHEFEKWAITLIPDAQPFRGGKKRCGHRYRWYRLYAHGKEQNRQGNYRGQGWRRLS